MKLAHPHSQPQLMPVVAALLAAALCSGAALADSRSSHAGHAWSGPRAPSLRLDLRQPAGPVFGQRAYAVPALSVGHRHAGYGGHGSRSYGGGWARPYGSRWAFVLPPLGLMIPLLPAAYIALTIGGAPYYYANGVYYAPAPGQGYVVVAPPDGADPAMPSPVPGTRSPLAYGPQGPATAPDPVVYPRDGQSAELTEADRQACNRWATTVPSAVADASVFQRAVAACMDGRGYTLR